MPPLRRRIDIPDGTARMLIARSGGYCANPSCRRDLFPMVGDRVATIHQLAHIIAQSPQGPRGDDPMPLAARNDGENVVLLCPECHTIVDHMNMSDVFTAEVLREWKRDHERRVRHGVSVHFVHRPDLDHEVASLLRRNSAVWRTYGPEGAAGEDAFGESAERWREQVREVIIPNNRLILELIDANADLLEPHELDVVEDFRIHAAALDLNHSSGVWRAGAPRFPDRIVDVFSD